MGPVGQRARVVDRPRLHPGLIPESRSESTTRHFDAAGAVSITAGLSLLAYALLDASSAGWGSTKIIGLLATSVILIAAFVAIELRSAAPLMPFRIFRLEDADRGQRGRPSARGFAVLDVLLHLAVHAEGPALQPDPRRAVLPASGVAIIVAAGVGGQLVTRIGFKPILATGMLLVATGLAWFGGVSVGGSFVARHPRPVTAGGDGTRVRVRYLHDRRRVRRGRDEQGLASGLINTSQQIGGALGLAVLSTIATSRTLTSWRAGRPPPCPHRRVPGRSSAER